MYNLSVQLNQNILMEHQKNIGGKPYIASSADHLPYIFITLGSNQLLSDAKRQRVRKQTQKQKRVFRLLTIWFGDSCKYLKVKTILQSLPNNHQKGLSQHVQNLPKFLQNLFFLLCHNGFKFFEVALLIIWLNFQNIN